MPTLVAIPSKIESSEIMRRLFRQIVEELDKLLGYRGSDPALRASAFEEVQTSIANIITQLEGLSTDAGAIQELLDQARRDISALTSVTAEEIEELRAFWDSSSLNTTYYDFDAADWDSLRGNFEFTANYEDLANAPYSRIAPLPAVEIYTHYIVTLPSIAGKAIIRMLVCEAGGALLYSLDRAQGTWL